jgi:FkbM family methyltransferase
MSLKNKIRKLLWKTGVEVCRFAPDSHILARRKQLLHHYDVDIVLDIGANAGQYAKELRTDLGYKGQIYSFEPLSSAFKDLSINSDKDEKWHVFNMALGSNEGTEEINIAGNSYSSSMLEMLSTHEESAPESKYIGKEIIKIKKLDSIFEGLCKDSDNVYMKIDTQGFESEVIKGANNSLPKIDTIQMEMSLVPLYSGELPFEEMCMRMRESGYNLVGLEPGFCDPNSGQLLQVDGIFHRV